MFYQIKDGYDISVSFESESIDLHQNINLPIDNILSAENSFDISEDGIFPENNIFIGGLVKLLIAMQID